MTKSEAAAALANMRPMRHVECGECGKTFTARDKRAKYCSNACRKRHDYRVKKEAK